MKRGRAAQLDDYVREVGRTLPNLRNTQSARPEPIFVNLLRSTGIDSQPGWPVRQPVRLQQRLAESIPGLLKRSQRRALVPCSARPSSLKRYFHQYKASHEKMQIKEMKNV